MARLNRVVVVLALFSVFSAPLVFAQDAPVKNKSNVGLGVMFKFFGFDASLGKTDEISAVPLELRQVPSHPEDTWIYGSKQRLLTIPYDSLSMGSFGGLNLSILPELTVRRVRVRSGLNFYLGDWGGGPSKSNEGNTREVNQYGKPERGYGTSLVYYSIYGKSSWKPGVTSEADVDIARNVVLIAGYGWNNYKLVSETGYDRWDALEKYGTQELASGRRTKRYLGIGFRPDVDNKGWRPISVNLLVGKFRTSSTMTEAGKGMTIDAGSPWFFEFGFATHGLFWKK